MKALAGGWTIESIDLWQLVRALDYLVSIEFVDTKRIGVYGISLGGQHALWLSALDQRISLVVCSAYFCDRFAWLFKRNTPSPSSPPGNRMMEIVWPIDAVEYMDAMAVVLNDLNLIALIQPRFLGIESGKRDPRHKAAEAEFVKVRKLYRHVGYPSRIAFMAFDGGHEISVENVMPFLKKWAGN